MLKYLNLIRNIRLWFCIEIVFCSGKAPVGRIFFSGEHTSERFSGYVYGGYLAGE
jgi:hypothetical protein